MITAPTTRSGRISRDQYLLRCGEYQVRGEQHHNAKLTDEQVTEIRSRQRQRQNLLRHIRDNLSNAALCADYGIHPRTLEQILSRETWAHLP